MQLFLVASRRIKTVKLKEPVNKNYCATVVKLDKFVDLPKCDNVKHAIILGNSVIVSKDKKQGEIGLFFPVETALSKDFLEANNLYRDQIKNQDPIKKGYFEDHGRIKCMKFRGHKSEGFFIELYSLGAFLFEGEQGAEDLAKISVGSEFDEVNGLKICEKYVPKRNQTSGLPGKKGKQAVKYISRLVDNQFRLHADTSNLRKNIEKINPDDIIAILYKLHGTSFAVGNVMVKEQLNWWGRMLKRVYGGVQKTYYDIVYSSRKVVKNEYETKNHKHFYGYDLWADIKEKLKDSIQKGITLYGEAVGYLETGGYIQEGYDYGCEPGKYSIYIYRITSTNIDGQVIEFTWSQIEDYCRKYGLNTVPVLYYGRAGKLFPISTEHHFHENFLAMAEKMYLEKDCYMCKNIVPAEGIVGKKDNTFDYEAYKLKSFRFLERETRELDKGIIDIETEQSEVNKI